MDALERMRIGGVQRAPSFDINRAADPSLPLYFKPRATRAQPENP